MTRLRLSTPLLVPLLVVARQCQACGFGASYGLPSALRGICGVGVVLLLCVTSALGADFRLAPGTWQGTGVVTVVVAVDGSQTITVTGPITITGGGGPVPPTPPSPSTLTVRAKAIRDAALTATADTERELTAQKLAVLYDQIAIKIRSGSISGAEQIAAVSKAGADILTGGKVAPWKPFRDTLTTQVVKLAQEGGDDVAYAKLFDEVSAGLLASVSPQAIDLTKWRDFIVWVIETIMRLFPKESFR